MQTGSVHTGGRALSGYVQGGQALSVYRDGLTGGVQLHSGRGLGGVLHHADVSWKTGKVVSVVPFWS